METTKGTQKQQEQEQKKPTEKRKPVFVKVDKLKPGTNGHTLLAKLLSSNLVLQKGPPASQNLSQTSVAECLVGDDTGTILFTAFKFMKPGVTVTLRNAKIDMFNGSKRLAVDKWGESMSLLLLTLLLKKITIYLL
ncbi:Drought-responsive family protein [Hibiscus syriacus]|uniref:Drought-responsive family protein n=1 Tax=Hibiscus syriacus TaxID=106335 RepID=A0A6A3CH83_HIBSY|nr:Drought-responsive family protein [Hibiscus syriacus]